MDSGLYKKYIGTPCKQNGIDPKIKTEKLPEVDLGTVKSTLVDKYQFNKSLDDWNKMTSQPGYDSKKSNEAFRKIEKMKTKDKKGKVVSAMSVFIDD